MHSMHTGMLPVSEEFLNAQNISILNVEQELESVTEYPA